MRWVLGMWALPMGVFWGWFFLSAANMHFGYVMLTRQVHELVFEIYGETLGVDPQTLPAMVAKACVVDTLLLLAICAFRRRSQLADWVKAARSRYLGETSPTA